MANETQKHLAELVSAINKPIAEYYRMIESRKDSPKLEKRIFDCLYVLQGVWVGLYANEWENMRQGLAWVIDHWDEPAPHHKLKGNKP